MSWRDRPWSGSDDGGMFGGGSRLRDNPMAWAPSLGSVFGIRVQIHILFIIFVAVELLRGLSQGDFWFGFRYLSILFALVFLHELGHCFGARRVGGSADQILMWPLGGLAYVNAPHRPGAHLLTAAAGPAVNLAVCVLVGLFLILGTGSLRALPWNPFEFHIPVSVAIHYANSELLLFGYQLFLVSYVLLLFNVCLPVFPLDGGRIFQAICWYRVGYRRSMMLATTTGMIGSVVLGCYGLFKGNFLLIGIAVFTYITTMQQRRMLAATADAGWGSEEYDLSAAQAGPEETRRSRRQQGAWARRQRKLAAEQAEVDRILAKVHEQGLQSLTHREKKTLARATRRQQEHDRSAGRADHL